MKRVKFRKILWIFFIISLLQFPFFWLRGGYITVLGLRGFPLSMLVFAIVYFIGAAWLMQKYREKLPKWVIITAILVGTMWFEVAFRIYLGGDTLISLPDFIIRILAACAGIGYSYIGGKAAKTIFAVCFALFALWCSCFGFRLWQNKLSYGTYNGRTEQVIESPLILQDIDGKNIPMNDFKGKYVVLDFWSATCGHCIKEFPEVNKLYEKLKADDQIVMYTVFCRRASQGETLQDGCDLMKRRGFEIPTLSTVIKDPVLEQIGVNGFPMVLVLDPEGKIAFRGSLELVGRYLNKIVR